MDNKFLQGINDEGTLVLCKRRGTRLSKELFHDR
jgi:hypothetical protein